MNAPRTATSEAIRRYDGEMRRLGFTMNTRVRYGRELQRFGEFIHPTKMEAATTDQCRDFLDEFADCKPATVALENTILRGFFEWLVDDEVIDRNPMQRVRRPKVPPLADREVVTITTHDVEAMLAACETWPEKLCIGVLAYTGARRNAAANLRWRDVDLRRGVVTLHEKGQKAITKPLADQLLALLWTYDLAHRPSPDDWVIPNRRPTGRDKRSNRIVYHLVKQVAARAGVKSHCHAVRAAFAVRYLETHPGQAEHLQALMGHSNIATTFGYLRRLDRERAMETVRGLSFTTESGLHRGA